MGGFNAGAFDLCCKTAEIPDGMKADLLNGIMAFKSEMNRG
jgi:hypothetical protein